MLVGRPIADNQASRSFFSAARFVLEGSWMALDKTSLTRFEF
jgi:hypothetical protein